MASAKKKPKPVVAKQKPVSKAPVKKPAAKLAPNPKAKPVSKPVAKPIAKPAKPAKPAPKPAAAISAARLAALPRPSLVAQFSGSMPQTAQRLPPRLQNLLDQNDLQQLLYGHCRALDRGEDNMLRSAYHPEATLDLGPGVFQGTVTDYISWIMAVLQQVKSSHTSINNCRLDIRGDEAFGEIYFNTHYRLDKPTGREDLFVGGRYLDRYQRRPAGPAGVWKIIHRKQVLDWARTEAVADIFYHLNPDALWGHRNKTDMSYQLEQFPNGQASGGGKLPTFVGRRYESKSIKL
jgi:hypothetical protein